MSLVTWSNTSFSFDSFVPSVASSSTFTIRHFAGDVVYDIYNLLNANADTLADDIISTFSSKVRFYLGHMTMLLYNAHDIFQDCNFGFVAHLFAVELNRDLHRKPAFDTIGIAL